MLTNPLQVVRKALSFQLSVGSMLLAQGTLCAILWVAHCGKGDHTVLQPGWQMRVNDSTLAVVADHRTERDELPALKDAAETLNGRLVAGVQIHTKADTVYAPLREVIQSTVEPDSTRNAVLVDTTESGIEVRVEGRAPPYPANLLLGYHIVVPEFNPEVGFVKVGNSYAAVVSWRGKQYTVENAFYAPQPTLPGWELNVGVRAGVTQEQVNSPQVFAGLQRKVGDRIMVGITGVSGVELKPQLEVSVKRVLWSR
jgi:hypothetical protein